MTSRAHEKWDAAARREEWIAKQLETAPPLTQEQLDDLRRILLNPRKKTA